MENKKFNLQGAEETRNIPIVYRETQPQDAEKILAYSKIVGGETNFLSFGEEGLPFTVEQEEKLLEDNVKAPKSCMIVALHDERIAGLANFQINKRERLAHHGSIGLSVRKEYWGRGIGSELLSRLIDFASSVGVEIVSLEVNADNERAIRLYERFGFEKFGTFRKAVKINGEYYDSNYMNLYLPKAGRTKDI